MLFGSLRNTLSWTKAAVAVGLFVLSVSAAMAQLKPTTITFSPTSAYGGSTTTVTGTVTMSAAVPAGGVTLKLWTGAAQVSVPTSVAVAGGATTATFPVTYSFVTASTGVNVYASYGPYSARNMFTDRALGVSSLASSSSATGGAVVTGTVTLLATPVSDTVVSLSSSDPSITVPGSVTVPAGSTTATFPMQTNPVATNTAVTITATADSVSRTKVVTVDAPKPATFSFNQTRVYGDTLLTGTVKLNGPAPSGGMTVSLAITECSAPTSFTVGAGSTSGTVQVVTNDVSATTTGTATLGTVSGTLKTNFGIMPNPLATFTVNSTSVTGGGSLTGTVTLEQAVVSDTTFSLTSTNGAVISPIATITIPAGSMTTSFTIPTSMVGTKQTVTIYATRFVTKIGKTITVLP